MTESRKLHHSSCSLFREKQSSSVNPIFPTPVQFFLIFPSPPPLLCCFSGISPSFPPFSPSSFSVWRESELLFTQSQHRWAQRRDTVKSYEADSSDIKVNQEERWLHTRARVHTHSIPSTSSAHEFISGDRPLLSQTKDTLIHYDRWWVCDSGVCVCLVYTTLWGPSLQFNLQSQGVFGGVRTFFLGLTTF